NPINVASGQAGQSAATASMSAITARRSAVSAGSLAKRSTSAASAERRARRRPASLKAARTASDSLRPSRISTNSARSDASSRRALTIREAMNETVAHSVSQMFSHLLSAPSGSMPSRDEMLVRSPMQERPDEYRRLPSLLMSATEGLHEYAVQLGGWPGSE